MLALVVAGCAPPSYIVVLKNDTSSVVVVHPVAVQSQKSFTLQPAVLEAARISSDTVGLRLTTLEGAKLGCLQPRRYRGGFVYVPEAKADLVSQARGACPGEGWFDFLSALNGSLWRLALLPWLFGALGAAVWLFIWARGRPRRARAIAAAESVGLCGLSAAILLLLVRWGGP